MILGKNREATNRPNTYHASLLNYIAYNHLYNTIVHTFLEQMEQTQTQID